MCAGLRMDGEVADQKVTLRFKTGQTGQVTATLAGVFDGKAATISGTWHLSAPEDRDGRFPATRR